LALATTGAIIAGPSASPDRVRMTPISPAPERAPKSIRILPGRALLWLLLIAAPMAQSAPAEPPQLPTSPAPEADAGAGGQPEGVLPLEDLRAFAEVLDRIRSSYVEEIGDRTLLESAIRGMLSDLDPHSAYLVDDAYDALQEATTGSFGGIGIEVSTEDGRIRVVTPIDDTPAQRAGLRAGDVIVRLDDEPVDDMTLSEAIDLMRGEPGTGIRLTVDRPDADEPIEFELERAVIEVASVNQRMLEPGFGYVRISQFQERTGADLLTALETLREENGAALDGLVLDLRNNPGGVLQASVRVADAFLTDGRIVYTEGRLDGAENSWNATAEDPSGGVPLVVLVNEGSASAAEIVAGALQDHHRAVIMGMPSFGKGSVQTVLPLSDERAIKLTTALYFTPAGHSIQARGIVPDITVERARVQAAETRRSFREADLPGHLANGNGNGEQSDNGDAKRATPASALTSDDYQLAEALNLLKGLKLLSRRTPAP
jgi:carboxyl-terminal processing protease